MEWLPHLAAPLAVLVASVAVWVFTGRRNEPFAVCILAIVFVGQELATMFLREKLPPDQFGPLCWVAGAIINLTILLLLVRLWRPNGAWWPRVLACLLMLGILAVLAMLIAYAPNADAQYNHTIYRIYSVYLALKNPLGRLELCCVAWPSIRDLLGIACRGIGPILHMPRLGSSRLFTLAG